MSKFGFSTAEFLPALKLVTPAAPGSYPVTYTVFHDITCATATEVSGEWYELCEMLSKPEVVQGEKINSPLIKMAEFGTERNPSESLPEERWSLRHTRNLTRVTGIEADYDGGVMEMDEARKLLEDAGVRAVLYSSWNDGIKNPPKYMGGPRWRVIAPFSEPLEPRDRARMVARINGALGGVLADESFVLAQGFFIGARPGAAYKCRVTFRDPNVGACVNDLPALDGIAIYKRDMSPDDSADERYSAELRPGSEAVAPQVYEQLRRALSVIPADCDNYEWFSVLRGLSRLSNLMEAKTLARDWSTSSSNPEHTLEVFQSAWTRMMKEDSAISYRKVLWLANKHSPAWDTGHAALGKSAPHPLALSNAQTSGASRVTPLEYVYDRFMSTGVNIIAGAAGVGKTTLVVPMALAVAHLCPHDHPMKPRLRRNVIIVTESVIQVQRVIYSLAQWGYTGLSSTDFDARVRVIQAQRLDPEVLSKVAVDYQTWTVDNQRVDGAQFKALPLVVFDTANAVLELENENDNSEVGRAMSLIKQAFHAFPVIIVAHMAKQLGFAESEGVGSRGASAWTGDAQGVYTVFKDGESGDAPRVLKATKVRFPTQWAELTFDLVSNREAHPNILGEMEEEHFNHSIARPLAPGERAQLKEDRQESKEAEGYNRLCADLLDFIRRDPGRAITYYSKKTLAEGGVSGGRPRKEKCLEALINDGSIEKVLLETPLRTQDHYVRVNEVICNAIEGGKYSV